MGREIEFPTHDPQPTTYNAPMSSTLTPIMELRKISRSFGVQGVLREISFAVNPGETLVIIGESGCGKSVMTKILAGLLEPTAGEVLWQGRTLKSRKPGELHRDRLQIGYLFQGAALFDSLNVFENVAFGLRENRRMSFREIQEIVAERLREVGLPPDTAQKRPADLSGGMRKRVALALRLGDVASNHFLRRTDDWPRSRDERRHQ